jgi:cytochrome c-type biogenesis protein
MLSLFNSLSAALSSSPAIAISAAFVWGILSIILSPCHLAGIPLIVGFINDREQMTTRKAFVLSFLFAIGILITIAFIGLITGITGRMLGDTGYFGNYFVAAVLIMIGLHLIGLIPLPYFGGINQSRVGQNKGLFAAFIIGLVFGVAMGPCTFAYMAPVLAIALNISSTNMLYGPLLLLAYGTGHCSIIVFAATFAESIRKYLMWNERSHGTIWIKKVCGVLVVLGGLYLIWGGR